MNIHVLVPNIVIDITCYWFEAGQKLVRSRSNYFCRTDNANFADFFGSIDRDRTTLLTTDNSPVENIVTADQYVSVAVKKMKDGKEANIETRW